MEELAEISKIFPQDRVQQSSTDQTIEIPAVSLAEKIVEMLVTQKTRQVVNTHVQHVVNAVEAAMLKIIKETVQRKRPVINEKINQVTKHHGVPQSQVVERTVDGQQLQIVGQSVETGQSTQTFESLGTAHVCQSTQAEIAEAVEIEVPIPAESASLMSVQRVQKTVEMPQIQFIDKLEVEHVVPTPVTEHMASTPAQSHADVSAGVKSDITWTTELTEIRQMVEFLVRRERKIDVKTDVAVRRLERLEREQDEQDNHDREASMTEALADRPKS